MDMVVSWQVAGRQAYHADMSISVSDIVVQDAAGGAQSLGALGGQVLLIVNVASKCGNTPQYAGLELLQKTYAARGFRVLGFPCNDYGAQEPGTLEEIQSFCTLNYGVTFPIFGKVHAKGDDKSPIYERLTQTEPVGDVRWNFEKFLVGRDGTVLARFGAKVLPDDAGLVAAIEHAL